MTGLNQVPYKGFLFFPKCPFYKSAINVILILILITIGTLGLFFVNVWISFGYLLFSVFYFFFLFPVKHCQYCYYKVKGSPLENDTGEPNRTLIPIEQWKETHLHQHIACGKRWSTGLMIVILGPIGLIGIFLVLNYLDNGNFLIYALFSLLGFCILLGIMFAYMLRKVCPTCAFQKECHAAF